MRWFAAHRQALQRINDVVICDDAYVMTRSRLCFRANGRLAACVYCSSQTKVDFFHRPYLMHPRELPSCAEAAPRQQSEDRCWINEVIEVT
ncbi:hypothetical protein AAV94_06060 [Lampropedia cohaerens]|uniref:Uncharacterized protein n=1 Tax=Lampropedia cohaerens TaxID=1610491 RepID=A0A0U1Q0G5_9BURK|nr:hypothetical protein AAV94_06060 [Lampropedia cohaerens]